MRYFQEILDPWLWLEGSNELRSVHYSDCPSHSWQRGHSPHILWRPPYIAYCPLFQILSTPIMSSTCGFLLVLQVDITHIYKHTHTHTKHTAHSEAVDLHNHLNIYLLHWLCAHSSYLYCIEWVIYWYQKITFHNVFSFQELFIYKGHMSID